MRDVPALSACSASVTVLCWPPKLCPCLTGSPSDGLCAAPLEAGVDRLLLVGVDDRDKAVVAAVEFEQLQLDLREQVELWVEEGSEG